MSSSKNQQTLDLEANFDKRAANALLQVTIKRGHAHTNEALSEAILLQAAFMQLALQGYTIIARSPDGDEMELPFIDLDETVAPH